MMNFENCLKARISKTFFPGLFHASWCHILKICLVFLGISGWIFIPGECRYKCPLKNFIRLGNSCYFLSSEIVNWQEAHFRCRDRGAQLAVLASQYEDSTLKNYLERPEFAQLGRWIGGMWAEKWIWAAQGTDIEDDQSFIAPEVFNLENTDQWMCLYMDSQNRYRWNSENCMRQLHYICESPLAKANNSHAILTESENDAPSVIDNVNNTTSVAK